MAELRAVVAKVTVNGVLDDALTLMLAALLSGFGANLVQHVDLDAGVSGKLGHPLTD